MMRRLHRWAALILAAAASGFAPAQSMDAGALKPVDARSIARPGKLSFAFRDAPIQEVFEMIARGERVNIVLRKGVNGTVSVNLYDVTLTQAIQIIAEAGGYVVEQPGPKEYIIVERSQAGQDGARSGMLVKTYRVQYSNSKFVSDILAKHLSRHGKITPLPERNLLVVEDHSEYQERIANILREIDIEPKQILIEAKILEISLDESESFGVDWNRIFNAGTGSGIGTQGLASRGTPGLFFNLVNDKITAYLSALNSKGRVHTLSTPKLLALENQEASVVIGDRIGYKVTTTINLVTSETVQFLETGVILRVTSSVDQLGRIMMKVRPEVSSGSISEGIPSKKSTEVATQLLAEDGQAILIGGLIKRSSSHKRNGAPILGDLPLVGFLFSNNEERAQSSETVVLITPRVIGRPGESVSQDERDRLSRTERIFLRQSTELSNKLPHSPRENAQPALTETPK